MWTMNDRKANSKEVANRFAATYFDTPRKVRGLKPLPNSSAKPFSRIFYVGTFRLVGGTNEYRLQGFMSGDWSVDQIP